MRAVRLENIIAGKELHNLFIDKNLRAGSSIKKYYYS
jgi:hypothetical protein